MNEPAGDSRLRVTEIFHSIQGESTRAGLPTVFVRLTGCPLRCVWCDTAYAFSGGTLLSSADILDEVGRYGTRYVCVTGGEPLAQRACGELLRDLCDTGYSVSLETSGALDLAGVDPRVSRIMDLKAPGSGECARNRWDNLDLLGAGDEIKIVLADEADYVWARDVLRQRRLAERCPVSLSLAHGHLPAERLAEWILGDALPVRLQLQLHKIIWGDVPGR